MTSKHYVGIYVRVSTQEQAREGHSVQEQESRLRAYCEAKDWNIVRVYIDGGFSGSNMERPELKRMLKDIDDGKIKTVLVYKLDRLSRSQKDTLHLIEEVFIKKGIDFVSMNENLDTSTPYGRAMIGILSAFAQLEREQIRERMNMGRVGRAKEGYFHGGGFIPIGYDYTNGELLLNDYEHMQIRKIFKMYVDDHQPINAIKKYLNDAGYTHGNRKKWTDTMVRSCLFTPLYKGDIVFQGNTYKGRHTPIYTEDEFERIMKEKDIRDTSKKPRHAIGFKRTTLLGGMIFCGKCGARYFAKQNRTQKNGEKPKYYTCYTRGKRTSHMARGEHCDNTSYNVHKLDAIILEEIKKLSFDHTLVENMVSSHDSYDVKDELIETQKRLDSVDDQISRLTDLFATGIIDMDMLQDKVASLTEEKTKLSETIMSLEDSFEPPALSRDNAISIIDEIADKIENAPQDELRELLGALIDKIMIYDDEIKIYWKFV